ncbi:hypothetical protein [Spiroplasma endosymbiont of Danaus chrysippus]|nr:hypothetical protein [Spiroplasma endosymbiont of Danaus chrysippus]
MTVEECQEWRKKFSKTKREDSPWNTSFDRWLALNTGPLLDRQF